MRRLGLDTAKRLFLTADKLDGAAMRDCGFLTQLVDDAAALDTEVQRLRTVLAQEAHTDLPGPLSAPALPTQHSGRQDMKQELRALSFAVAALLTTAGALADSYPARPITLVVGFPAGGGADTVARIVGDKMAKLLGQPIVIDNKPGAGTTIASDQIARAAPDGYTLLLGSANRYGSDKLLYKSVKSFTLASGAQR